MRKLLLLSFIAVGCGTDATVTPPSLAFLSPTPSALFARDQLATSGALVANVAVQLEIGGEPARVVIKRGDLEVGSPDADGTLLVDIRELGTTTLTATAFDVADVEVASASVSFAIEDATAASCHDWLDLYNLEYTVGPNSPGIDDPVTVKAPINGVAYRYNGSEDQRKTLYADCTLIKSLADAAPIMREHDIVELVDIGIYNYRCIDQSKTPPDCTLSQHAYANAIDIAGWKTSDSTYYSVLTDWLIDPATMTCTAPTDGAKDTFLHDVICQLKAAGIWNIVLTPNYNSAHRNHFHVDLTAGADTIKRDASGAQADLQQVVFDTTSAAALFAD